MGFLKYRFPNREVEDKKGVFVSTETFSENCFVLSDFTQKKKFVFKEGGEQEVVEFEAPKVYSKQEYFELAKRFKHKMIEKGCAKAIFSRVKKVDLPISGSQLFERLCENYPNALTYHFFSPNLGEWIGATPEILIDSQGETFETVSLAGTKLVSDDSDWQQKEIDEQAFVSDFIRASLRGTGVSNLKETEVKEKVAGPVKHLLTEFSFVSDISKDTILKALHPTPAVSGLPQSKAIQLIESTERHSRSFYTGFLGEYGEKSSVYVNLRCAQIIENQLFLYLGGGFTKDSDIQAEYEETENKATTLLNVLKDSV